MPEEINNTIDQMFKVGAHFGFGRSRRHPSMSPYIFGVKNRVEIFDLEKSKESLEKAKMFLASQGAGGKTVLFVGGKNEAREAVRAAATSLSMPYVAGRWIGGALTNFSQIRSRVDKMLDLQSKREKGELAKYTKKERLLIDREIEKLEKLFTGLVPMKELPKALVVMDPKHEYIAVSEAKKINIPVVALLNSDCDAALVSYPIPGNDALVASVSFFIGELAKAYEKGQKNAA